MSFNANSKRKREDINEERDGFGSITPKRLRDSYGNSVVPSFGFITPKATCSRVIAPDLVDSIHLGDPGYFLFGGFGQKYYLARWSALRARAAARGRNGKYGILSNIYGSKIPPFKLYMSKDVEPKTTLATYNYVYANWYTFQSKRKGGGEFKWEAWFANIANSYGLNTSEEVSAAFQRVLYFFDEARKMWCKAPSRDEVVAYLQASETYWFDKTFIVPGNKDRCFHYGDMWKGEEPYYVRQIDMGSPALLGHVERQWKLMQLRARLEGTQAKAVVFQKAKRQCKRGVLLNPKNLLTGKGYEAYKHSQQISTDDDLVMCELFDFDKAMEDGVCRNDIVESVEKAQNASVLGWQTTGMTVKEAMAQKAREMRKEMAMQGPTPGLPSDNIARIDFAMGGNENVSGPLP